MEILEVSKSMFVDDIDDFFENQEEKPKKELSEANMYKKIKNKSYFEDNFIQIMTTKYINIFNYLNDENIIVDNIENKEDQQKEENPENQENRENQGKEENIEKVENEEKKENEENKDNQKKVENKENNIYEKGEKPLVLFFIEDRLPKLKTIINNSSKKIFDKIFKIKFQDYLSDLQKEQSLKNKEFDVNSQIIDVAETEQIFKDKLFKYFNNEFFKNFFCIILKLFMTNLKNTLIDNYKKELKENEIMKKIINKKAEDSLKYITQKLHESLIKELNENFNDNNNEKIEEKKEVKNEFNDVNMDDMNFDY